MPTFKQFVWILIALCGLSVVFLRLYVYIFTNFQEFGYFANISRPVVFVPLKRTLDSRDDHALVKEDEVKGDPHNIQSARYLLPILLYSHMGPNSIYHGIRFSIDYALRENRSIVQVPFKAHRVSNMSDGMSRIKTFSETFDVDKLSELLPVSTTDDYRRDCGSDIPLDSLVNLRSWKKKEIYIRTDPEIEEDILGIRLPVIPDPGRSSKMLLKRFFTSMDIPCIAVLLRDVQQVYENRPQYRLKKNHTINQYLTRALYIRQMADRVTRLLYGDEDFVVLHWRAMVEICSTCTFESLQKQRNKIIDVTHQFIKSHNMTCLYISAPPQGKNISELFRRTGLHVEDSDSIRNIRNFGKYLDVFLQDAYKMSLLEQEIGVRAKIFIKNRWSNWSQFVEFTREAMNRQTITYENIPGTPVDLLKKWRILKK